MAGSADFLITGWEHIVDINAYDHLLFVMTLCAAYKIKQWRDILIIITAFTVGHCVTLILCSLEFLPTNRTLVDMLIPFTIMITAIANVAAPQDKDKRSDVKLKYGIALGFGLIHGLAFATNFKALMFGESIIAPLFFFNLGIEIGQLFIVLIFMLALWVYTKFLKGQHLKWNLFVSGAGFGIASIILLKTINGA